MIYFDRKAGTLYDYPTGKVWFGIWSGHGDAANDPTREREKGIGPLPAGLYRYGQPRDGGHLGPFVLDLTQIAGASFDRSLFRVHGDTAGDIAHTASDGCIIAPRNVREWLDEQTDRRITVI